MTNWRCGVKDVERQDRIRYTTPRCREGLMNDALELHYGSCRIHCPELQGAQYLIF